MEQPGGWTPKRGIWKRLGTAWGISAFLLACGALGSYFNRTPGQQFTFSVWLTAISIVGFVLFAAATFLAFRLPNISIKHVLNSSEAQARQRVRQAEDKLSEELRRGSKVMTFEGVVPAGDSGRKAKIHEASIEIDRLNAQIATRLEEISLSLAELPVKKQDDRLTLAALWDVTHGRMDLYHQIVTGQARRSFIAAQFTMGIGFVLLVAFAMLAVEAKTAAAAVSAGGLGAVGAAFSAYIGKTFIRSQESAADHLRAYFDQPLELSRYLAAERLLADAEELSPEQRTAMLGTLVQSIAAAGHDNNKSTGRKPRNRASR